MTPSPRGDLLLALAEILAGPLLWAADTSYQWPGYIDLSRLVADSPAACLAIQALGELLAESPDRRRERYDSLINGTDGRPRLWLYESAAKTGRILSPQTFEIARLYRASGLESTHGAELPDHASLELNFIAYLVACAEKDSLHAAKWHALEQQFINEHGDWLIKLGSALSTSGDPIFAPIGALLAELLTETGSVSHYPNDAFHQPISGNLLPVISRLKDCTLCGFCVQACPARALAVRESESDTKLEINVSLCFGCGKCVRICGMKAISLAPAPFPFVEGIRSEGTLLVSPRVPCPSCGKPTVSRAELDYVGLQLGNPAWLEYCLDCRIQFHVG